MGVTRVLNGLCEPESQSLITETQGRRSSLIKDVRLLKRKISGSASSFLVAKSGTTLKNDED